jgi:hypothetical protein
MRKIYDQSDLLDFSKRHGNPLKLPNRWLFSDGAIAWVGEWGVSFEEPSNDPRERLAVRREWHLAKLGRAQKDFQSLKSALLGGGTFQWPEDEYGKPPTDRDEHIGGPDGRPALRLLQRLVIERREELEKIDAEIAASIDNRRDNARRKQNEMLDQQAAERDQALHDEIAKIEI